MTLLWTPLEFLYVIQQYKDVWCPLDEKFVVSRDFHSHEWALDFMLSLHVSLIK